MRWLYRSPLGPICYEMVAGCCRRIELRQQEEGLHSRADAVSRWLDAYFSGCTLPLPRLAEPASAFQQRLRHALCSIAFGEVVTYGELARQLGTAPRALGQALKANPMPLIVPCHRVVAADGLGGFSCGLEWKRALLAFEQDACGRTMRC